MCALFAYRKRKFDTVSSVPLKKEKLESLISSLKPSVQCPHCSYAFYHKAVLTLHLRRHARASVARKQYSNSVARAKSFKALITARQKFQCVRREIATPTCKKCNIILKSAAAFKCHWKKRHVRQFKCRTCSTVFVTKRLQQIHLAKSSDCRPEYQRRRLLCSRCPRAFLYDRCLQNHMTQYHKGV